MKSIYLNVSLLLFYYFEFVIRIVLKIELSDQLEDRPPQCSAHGSTEMRSAYIEPITPPRLVTDKDQFKHPANLPGQVTRKKYVNLLFFCYQLLTKKTISKLEFGKITLNIFALKESIRHSTYINMTYKWKSSVMFVFVFTNKSQRLLN